MEFCHFLSIWGQVLANVTLLVVEGGSTDLSALERVGGIRGRTRERSSAIFSRSPAERQIVVEGKEGQMQLRACLMFSLGCYKGIGVDIWFQFLMLIV